MSQEALVKISEELEIFSPLDRWNEYSRWQKFVAVSSPSQNFWRFCKAPMIKQLLALKYTDGKSMTYHLNNFQGIMNQLSAIGIKFDEEIQITHTGTT